MQESQNRLSIQSSMTSPWSARNALADKSPVLEGRHNSSGQRAEEQARFVAVDVRPTGKLDAPAGSSPSALTVVLGNGRTLQLAGTLEPSQLVKLVVLLERVLDGTGSATRIYLAQGAFDMRTGFNALFALVRSYLSCNPRSLLQTPQSGYAFVFANAQRNQLKVLYFDRSGMWLCNKRVEKGLLNWPASNEASGKIVLSPEECGLLLGGVDLKQTRRQRWCHHTAE